MLSHYKNQKRKLKSQDEERQNWQIIKAKIEEKLKEQGQIMAKLQIYYVFTIKELEIQKTKALEWKDKTNQNGQEKNQLNKEIDILRKTNVITMVNNVKETQTQLQELLQMEVQRMTSTNVLKDQELVKETTKLKANIVSLRK